MAGHFTEQLNCSHISSPSSLPGCGLAGTACALKACLTLNALLEDRVGGWEGKIIFILCCRANAALPLKPALCYRREATDPPAWEEDPPGRKNSNQECLPSQALSESNCQLALSMAFCPLLGPSHRTMQRHSWRAIGTGLKMFRGRRIHQKL